MLGAAIFAVTYVLVSARRLGWLAIPRSGAAMLGAGACVLFGVLSPEQALNAVDGHTLVLLFGMMGMATFLGLDGFFERAAFVLERRAHTPALLLGAVVWIAGLASAFLTNDAVCILGTPVLLALIARHRLPPLPYLLALTTGANTGSVATVVGNPQNMLCASLGDISYLQHLLHLGPIALVGLAANHALLAFIFRAELRAARLAGTPIEPPAEARRSTDVFVVLAAVVVLFSLGANLAFTALGGCAALLVWRRQLAATVLQHVDAAVLLFFAGLFIVVEALVRTGLPERFFALVPLGDGRGLAGMLQLSATFLLGANIVSNVPFIMVVREHVAALPDPQLGWMTLAMASTFAGNLTLLGSVANIIVAERARAVGGIGFLAYLRVGLPLALLTTGLGALWLLWVGAA